MAVFHDVPEDTRDEFHKVQDEIDRSQWVGRGPSYELPGGGNADNDSDRDPIERGGNG